jgi:hypothetical protein
MFLHRWRQTTYPWGEPGRVSDSHSPERAFQSRSWRSKGNPLGASRPGLSLCRGFLDFSHVKRHQVSNFICLWSSGHIPDKKDHYRDEGPVTPVLSHSHFWIPCFIVHTWRCLSFGLSLVISGNAYRTTIYTEQTSRIMGERGKRRELLFGWLFLLQVWWPQGKKSTSFSGSWVIFKGSETPVAIVMI